MSKLQQGSFWALSPLIVFVLLFLGVGIITGDFTTMPLNVAIVIASIFGLVQNRKKPFGEKIDIFTKGVILILF